MNAPYAGKLALDSRSTSRLTPSAPVLASRSRVSAIAVVVAASVCEEVVVDGGNAGEAERELDPHASGVGVADDRLPERPDEPVGGRGGDDPAVAAVAEREERDRRKEVVAKIGVGRRVELPVRQVAIHLASQPSAELGRAERLWGVDLARRRGQCRTPRSGPCSGRNEELTRQERHDEEGGERAVTARMKVGHGGLRRSIGFGSSLPAERRRGYPTSVRGVRRQPGQLVCTSPASSVLGRRHGLDDLDAIEMIDRGQQVVADELGRQAKVQLDVVAIVVLLRR